MGAEIAAYASSGGGSAATTPSVEYVTSLNRDDPAAILTWLPSMVSVTGLSARFFTTSYASRAATATAPDSRTSALWRWRTDTVRSLATISTSPMNASILTSGSFPLPAATLASFNAPSSDSRSIVRSIRASVLAL